VLEEGGDAVILTLDKRCGWLASMGNFILDQLNLGAVVVVKTVLDTLLVDTVAVELGDFWDLSMRIDVKQTSSKSNTKGDVLCINKMKRAA
jgi:hypothetical protein